MEAVMDDKWMTLAEFLRIEEDDDLVKVSEYRFRDESVIFHTPPVIRGERSKCTQSYLVFTKDELIKYQKVQKIINRALSENSDETIYLEDVAYILGKTEMDIKEFFIPDILTGHIDTDQLEETIELELLNMYLSKKKLKKAFIEGYTKLILDNDNPHTIEKSIISYCCHVRKSSNTNNYYYIISVG